MTSKKLSEYFSFEYNGFEKPIEWSDATGFTRIKQMPDGHASMLKMGVNKKQLHDNNPLKELHVSVSYGKVVPEGITFESRKSLWDPIDIRSDNEYFYNIDSDKFYKQDKEVTPKEIITGIEDLHMKPTKLVKGSWLRIRLWLWRKAFPFLIKYTDVFLIKLLWLISGEKIRGDLWKRVLGKHSEYFKEPISDKGVQFKESKTMEFFGYKAKRWSVVFYSVLHLCIYSFFYKCQIDSIFLRHIITNNFLALCYVITSFAITEALIPSIIKELINKITPKMFNAVSFKSLKV